MLFKNLKLIVIILFTLSISIIASKSEYKKPIWQGSTQKPYIALTFDDGPKPELTTEMLRLLDKYNVRASFFLVGKQAVKYKDFIVQIAESGHDIANHSFTHPNLTLLSAEEIYVELNETNKVLTDITKQTVTYFRPPGGQFNKKINEVANKLNLQTVFWSINAIDYIHNNDGSIVERNDHKRHMLPLADYILQQLKPGSIILLHNGSRETNEALPTLIEEAQKKGYEFVTLKKLLTNSSAFL